MIFAINFYKTINYHAESNSFNNANFANLVVIMGKLRTALP